MKSQTNNILGVKWGFPLLLIGLALVWCYFEALAFMGTRGGAVGFHPCVILAIPLACLIWLGIVAWAYCQKSLAIGLCSFLPVLILGSPILYAYQLGIYGWSQEIRSKSNVNAVAIASVDFSEAQFNEVPYKDHERMVKIAGFEWNNADKMIAAKNGEFYGFAIDSVPHVYICPLMNGSRGIAWVPDTSKINDDPNVKYEYTGVSNWYIWTLSG